MTWLCRLREQMALPILILSLTSFALPTTKPHVITLGKWNTVQWLPGLGATDEKPVALKVRPLLIDARVKEFTLGTPHDVTDRLFVIRRAFRVNDSLPQESTASPHWQWQRGGWLLVDRVSGHVSPINLPEFNAFYSAASWYRDYAAYCGVSDDDKKVYAVVAQISRRKAVLKKLLAGVSVNIGTKDSEPDSACPVPGWQRAPARVTFEPTGVPKQTFAIRAHTVDLVADEQDDDEEAAK
ncbi:MAG TPA: hypothetical protein VFF50_10510 [Candidatus Deferrimicrobiaceae bacterium]|nr:hypothetical protein [Candidatus Deferrimicrobiaceae bacterium]